MYICIYMYASICMYPYIYIYIYIYIYNKPLNFLSVLAKSRLKHIYYASNFYLSKRCILRKLGKWYRSLSIKKEYVKYN